MSSRSELDPVRIEVFRNALTAIADEMGVALRRAAYSTNIKTRLDYSCALFDPSGRTLAQAFTQPIHLGTLRHFVPRILETIGADTLNPGDAVLCNDGHLGGIHLNDVCLVAPIHHDGQLLGYAATMAHHVDIGGGTPGSIGLFEEIFQEGLQIAPVRIVKAGKVDDELMRLISAIKAGDKSDAVAGSMQSLAGALVSRGCQAIIAGCTEIPLVLEESMLDVPLISSTDLLAEATVRIALA